MRFVLPLVAAGLAAPAFAQDCGGDWSLFLDELKAEALATGVPAEDADRFLSGARQDPSVLEQDRGQGIFQADFVTFSRRLISQDRVDRAARLAGEHDATFDRIETDLGVPRGILLAFWAFETDFGQVQGDFDTTNALLTLAHDCRRPELFRPEALAAMRLHAQGRWDTDVRGAWAGEIGQVQMLPRDILEFGSDGDGDGIVDLKGSSDDALLSGARMLAGLGWRPDEPWLQEVTVPDSLDWSLTGLEKPRSASEWATLGVAAREGGIATDLPAALVLPLGRKGPAFLAYPNFSLLTEWNQSLTYVLTAGYFATRIMGAPVYDAGEPDPALSGEEMKFLQQRLQARGHDVGEIDGILGARTRVAVQAEQVRLGLPADAWPTQALLDAL
ncbi:lytic murein transglycosylase [Rubellimicrobium rubrum]|uniref:Lytic murein transglycosylase n=1 Tax=Rubellimicrobium rubrum TaxID=2585369 RepID=A0A5C4N3H9_9RHOB|nr:lytic murein transglycosylase [Rubellimicrobium rubrum]TNC52498.1 lytic murein transglycosylase [Rubellimicrobium rubrum]